MPKMKSNRGATKRFRTTGTGKIVPRPCEQEPPADREVDEADAGAAQVGLWWTRRT